MRVTADREYSLPRRYRPPARRRKSNKGDSRQGTTAPTYGDAATPVPTARPGPGPSTAPHERSSRVRHIARDHSYVLGEVRLIALLMAFITGGLVITAILR